jgi:predicted lipoprotein with Yx(FWY)xxD motif
MITRSTPARAGWLAIAGVATLILGGCAPASAPSGGPSSGTPVASGPIHTASTPLGEVIVDGAGMTAYVFDNDIAGSGSSACSGACATQWPAITTSSATPEVEGVTGTVGTIDAAGGGKQVTIDGHPLYTYAGDAAPGDTTGQGFGGIWWVVDPSGAEITQSPASDDRGY